MAGHCTPPPSTGGAPNAGGAPNTGGASGDGGIANAGGVPSDGGAANTGGAADTGGAPSTGGVTATGGTPETGGIPSTGGLSNTGGVANTGGVVSTGGIVNTGGVGGGCADSDGDGLTDCVEAADGNAWTDPAIFNGVRVRRANQCAAAGACTENDTLTKVNTCMATVAETRDQYSGWDWENPPDDICSAEYAFKPPWTGCDNSWAAEWQGCIHLTGSGPHCIQIAGGTQEGCAALYFGSNTGAADTRSGQPASCFDIPEGNYPIRWHYTMDDGSSSSMHVRYCNGMGTACVPTVAIPSSMLRVTCP